MSNNQWSNMDKIAMRRCLDLARSGLGHTKSNPLVGCVIVQNGEVIGEGYHQYFGGPHAEVNAISSVADEARLAGSTLYVNLEPCSHHGKTPPCANLIIEKRIGKVVIAHLDPHELVRGNGIKRLKEAGVDVLVGVLEEEARELNKRFFTWCDKGRPYIILKWAQTADGFIDYYRNDDSTGPLKISGYQTDVLVHKWRAEEDAILVGRNTVELDDPSLTARLWPGKSPLRIIIDPQLQLSNNYQLFKDGRETWIYNALKDAQSGSIRFIQINNAEKYPQEIVRHLSQHHVGGIIIEGGHTTLKRFIEAGLWDEARVILSPIRIGQGVPAPDLSGTPVFVEMIASDQISIFRNA
ncbi:MAG: bifunctional diaminohydroxyphosphoribosylaminopyrimidine deaminase/5-amino-6-(5-phosphoribosylamino)uracil reductase RibD [Salibacteraceae bacterium]